MRALRAVAFLHASLAAALGLTSAGCTSASSSSGSGTGGDASPATHHFACIDPLPILVTGKDTGYDTCKGGTVRRRAILDCPTAPLPTSECTYDAAPSGVGKCASNGDCDAGPFGVCSVPFTDPYAGYCSCSYGCARDSDCASGQICLCGDPVGRCVGASCNAGTCGAGEECASYWLEYCTGCLQGFACQSVADTCFSDLDCDGGVCTLGGAFTPGPTTRWCSYGSGGSCCGFGRPFLVGHDPRVAASVERADWRASLAPEVASLSPSERARLARHWTEAGRMEHASIAAFARFALQLLSLGAPPDLVVAAQRAMEDETRHAQLAFGLASAYAGAEVGPGPLDVRGSLEAMDLRSIVATTFAEGCIGETVATLEASEALADLGDRDPAVAAVLTVIATDEARHAELAWRSVAWMVQTFGQAARDALEDAVRASLAEPPRPVHDEALRGIVLPLSTALLGEQVVRPRTSRPVSSASSLCES